MHKTPTQKGSLSKKVKRVCSFKGFNKNKDKRKEKYTLGEANTEKGQFFGDFDFV